MTKLSKDLEKRIIELRGKQFSMPEIMRMVGLDNPTQVAEVLDRDKIACINAFKQVDKNSVNYREVLINAVRLLRTEYKMNYRQISEALGESEYIIFDIIRRNPVSLGCSGYIKGVFTREEKRMRNEDMIRLNKEGKTLIEIGKIYFTSKQNVSAILKDIEYKPLSEKEALTVGIETPVESVKVQELEAQITELKNELVNARRQLAVAKYQMNGTILDLRIGYTGALMENINAGEPSDETVQQYKQLRHTLRRVYNALINGGAEETAEVEKLTKIMPKLLKTDKLVK